MTRVARTKSRARATPWATQGWRGSSTTSTSSRWPPTSTTSLGHTTHITSPRGRGPLRRVQRGRGLGRPSAGGDGTTDPVQADPCVGLLGPNQPGIDTPGSDGACDELYDGGTSRSAAIRARFAPAARPTREICDPAASPNAELPDTALARRRPPGPAQARMRTRTPPAGSGGSAWAPDLPADPEEDHRRTSKTILDLPGQGARRPRRSGARAGRRAAAKAAQRRASTA